MENFWDFSVWGSINLVAVLLISLLLANVIKTCVPFMRNSLVPSSVIGGLIMLIIAIIYMAATGDNLFDTDFFGGNGSSVLEIVTYHALALGFIATTFRPSHGKLTKKQASDVFNTGCNTVATYLLQGILGLGITMLLALAVANFFPAAGILLPFGYGQGTGQAMNYGNIYENDYAFTGGKSFGLSIAALGFLSASLGGVIHLAILKRKGFGKATANGTAQTESVSANEIPDSFSMDKLTVQVALVVGTYLLAYLVIWGLGSLIPGFKSVLYGFNFLFGVLFATLVKAILNRLKKGNVVKREYVSTNLMNRIGGFCFDLMIVAGVAAIRLDMLVNYWWILLILGVVGAASTYFYNRFVAKTLFPDYAEQQFLATFGMLTGTASTGIILLREIDPDFATPAAENLVYQNFPAIVFGFPMMLLATLAPKQPLLTWGILLAFFIVMNVILFRTFIFKKRKKA